MANETDEYISPLEEKEQQHRQQAGGRGSRRGTLSPVSPECAEDEAEERDRTSAAREREREEWETLAAAAISAAFGVVEAGRGVMCSLGGSSSRRATARLHAARACVSLNAARACVSA